LSVLEEEEFEDTKGVIIIHKPKKYRQHNGQQKKDKGTNNDLQSTTHKAKYRVTRTPLNTRVNSYTPEGYSVPAALVVKALPET
jgi:hypothetical protein